MSPSFTRRNFLALTTGAFAAPKLSWPAPPQNQEDDSEVPAVLDHIIIGCNDLDAGIDFVKEGTGVRAKLGGVHPGRGTRNALLSLGERRYLEIIAPDSSQGSIVHFPQILGMKEPRLIGWAAHPGNLDDFAKKIRAAGIAFVGPTPGSRARADGTVLNWKTINLADDRHGLLPFFIEWSAETEHPSKDTSAHATLEYFQIMSSDPDELSSTFKKMGLDLPVQRSDKPRLRALISGPKGDLGLSA